MKRKCIKQTAFALFLMTHAVDANNQAIEHPLEDTDYTVSQTEELMDKEQLKKASLHGGPAVKGVSSSKTTVPVPGAAKKPLKKIQIKPKVEAKKKISLKPIEQKTSLKKISTIQKSPKIVSVKKIIKTPK